MFSRRMLLKASAGAAVGIASAPALAQRAELTAEQWMDEWMTLRKAPRGTLHLSRFADPIYFLTKPISWSPSPDQVDRLEAVDVPKGFVTDFASIPKPFWTLLRPDGEYTYAAIVHDFLYWTQSRSRQMADQVFKLVMQDFGIDARITAIVHSAVRVGGGVTWGKVTELKAKGEKRLLKRFPEDPRMRWEDWKRRPDVFA